MDRDVSCGLLRPSGFSLIELLISLALFSILISIALPSYSYLVQDRHADAAARQLFTLLSYTREQAIIRNRQVVICAAADDSFSQCIPFKWSGRSDWSQGVMIFIDGDKNERFSADNDELLKVARLDSAVVDVSCTTGSFIAYKGTGILQGFSNGTLTFTSGDYSRQLKVTNIGRVRFID